MESSLRPSDQNPAFLITPPTVLGRGARQKFASKWHRKGKEVILLFSLHTGRTQFNATTTPGLAPPQLLCVYRVGGTAWEF